MTAKLIKDSSKQVFAMLKKLTKEHVFVGVPLNANSRRGESETNAQIARTMEFGSPAKNIPPRPFLAEGLQSGMSEIMKHMKNASIETLTNKDATISFNKAGLSGQNAVKNYIVSSGNLTPLSQATIKARNSKRKNGQGGSKPLIDTGQLLNAITYVVRSE